jgi:hypothetical protein
MQIDLAALPSDIKMLHQLVRDLAGQMAGEQTELAEARAEVKRLKLIIHRLQRSQFGRRSEHEATGSPIAAEGLRRIDVNPRAHCRRATACP